MIRVSVFFPRTNDGRFDMDYFLSKHVPMVKARLKDLGLVDIQVDEGLEGATPDQPAPYAVIAHMSFEQIEDFKRGMEAHGAEIVGDFVNFTNLQTQLQISRALLPA